MDALKEAHAVELVEALRVQEAQCRAGQVDQTVEASGRWPTWLVVVTAAAAFAVGGAVGLGLGIVVM